MEKINQAISRAKETLPAWLYEKQAGGFTARKEAAIAEVLSNSISTISFYFLLFLFNYYLLLPIHTTHAWMHWPHTPFSLSLSPPPRTPF